jgi:cytochrome b involved in lipid metabolism
MAEVATHNTAQNCWTAIDGNVYNVTSWINQHPGGAQAIISLCGIDGSNAFNGQHGGQKRPL